LSYIDFDRIENPLILDGSKADMGKSSQIDDRASQLIPASGTALQAGLVSIIIVTRNSEGTLPACLRSIQNQIYAQHEIILVDNGSTDHTLSLINPQSVTLLTNKCNQGFAKANNQALAIAKGEFVLFLNSDATIEPNFLRLSIPYFEADDGLGAISAKILRSSNGVSRVIDSTGLLLQNWRLLPLDRGEGEIDTGQYDNATTVFGAPGACALYRRSALEIASLGREVMDEDFFAYYEDVDLAWRIRRRKWTTLYVPEAIAYHCKRGPGGKENFIQVKAFTNRYWCYIKNARAADFLSYAIIAIPYEIARVFRMLIRKPSWIPAYFAEWRLLVKMLNKRSTICGSKRKAAGDA
jgi:GT2 family glycosyltransferase